MNWPAMLDHRDCQLLREVIAQGGKVFVTRQGGKETTDRLIRAAEAQDAGELVDLLQRLDDFALIERDQRFGVAFKGEITEPGREIAGAADLTE